MAYNPYPRLPIGPLRDLYGITRALYRASRAGDQPDTTRLEALEAIGKDLRSALREAREHPGTIPYEEAWAAAERAIGALDGFVAESMRLAPLINVTAECISRARQTHGASGEVVSTWQGNAPLGSKPAR